MNSPFDLLRDAGIFAWPILFVFMLSLGAMPALALAAALKRRAPAAAWLALPALMLVLGSLGAAYGAGTALEAIAFASPETQSILAAAGYGQALTTDVLALRVAGVALAWGAFCAGMANLSVGEGARWTPGRAGAALGIGLFGAVASAVMALVARDASLLFISAVGVAAALGVGASALRDGALRDGALRDGALEDQALSDDADRVAAGRASTSAMALGAALAMGFAAMVYSYSQIYQALAFGDPELLGALVAHGEEVSRSAALVGALSAGGLLVAGAVASASALRLLSDRRTLFGFGLVGALGVFVGGARAAELFVFHELRQRTPLEVAAALLREVPTLPVVQHDDGLGRLLTPKRVWRAGAWVGEAETDTVEGIAAPASAPAEALFELEPSAYSLAVQQARPDTPHEERDAPPAVGSLRVTVGPIDGDALEGDPLAGLVVPEPGWDMQKVVTACAEAMEALGGDNTGNRDSGYEDQRTCWVAPERPPPRSGLGTRMGLPGDGGSADEALILGSVDKADIAAVIRSHVPAVRACYERGLQRDPSLQGEMKMKVVISQDGSVSSASAGSSTLGDSEVEGCVTGVFSKMQFAAPTGGGIAIVSYPLVFK